MLQFFLAAVLLAGLSLASSKRPNILFVLTDDQDSHMEAAEHMPYLQVCSGLSSRHESVPSDLTSGRI